MPNAAAPAFSGKPPTFSGIIAASATTGGSGDGLRSRAGGQRGAVCSATGTAIFLNGPGHSAASNTRNGNGGSCRMCPRACKTQMESKRVSS